MLMIKELEDDYKNRKIYCSHALQKEKREKKEEDSKREERDTTQNNKETQ